MPLLDVAQLNVSIEDPDGVTELVAPLSFSIRAGETLCVVGESGSGKTLTALSLIRLLEYIAPVKTTGRIAFDGVDLAQLPEQTMRTYRGRRIAMIFQEALESLNPSMRIGEQLTEAFHTHNRTSKRASQSPGARQRALEKACSLLIEVGLSDTDRILRLYPHQISGGMQQRVMIALALMADPELLLADEPTTALDVTTQAEILELLRKLQRKRGMSTIFITHDMGVAASIADRIAVMYGGRLVEVGMTREILRRPQHHYTAALLDCVPTLGRRRTAGFSTIPGSVPSPSEKTVGCRFAGRCPAAQETCFTTPPELQSSGTDGVVACWFPLERERLRSVTAAPETTPEHQVAPKVLEVRSLTKDFSSRRTFGRKTVHRAVDQANFEIAEGEIFGLVGESGSGKTTLGRMLAGLERPSSGVAQYRNGHVVSGKGIEGPAREFRRNVQIVFQDPRASLDPRFTVAQIVEEPLRALTALRGTALADRVHELLDQVGLPSSLAARRTTELSGGQRQRVAIARAIAPRPSLIIADEPTSALDVSVQGQVMNLLLELQETMGLSFLFITHNLSLILSVADRLGVMSQGQLVQIGGPDEVMADDAHPYTRRLLAANPDLEAVAV